MSVNKLGENFRTAEVGLTCTTSGIVTVGEYLPDGESGKFIMTSAAGDILVEGMDGRNYWLPSVPANQIFPFAFKKVLASGNDWQGNSHTTVNPATFYWFRGI